jgi:DNA-directed RNA polymerase specialized sigma24 family protein
VSQTSVDNLPVDQRQAIFLALVESQDGGMTVATSRAEIARRFSVTENQVKEIEREGLSNQWPPLS